MTPLTLTTSPHPTKPNQPPHTQCDFKPWYTDLGFRFEENMPKHPMIKKPLYEVFPVMRYDMRFGQFHDGPVAGRQREFDGAFIVEVSDRTFKGMLDHKVRARFWNKGRSDHTRGLLA